MNKLRTALVVVLFAGIAAGVVPQNTKAQSNVPSYGAAPMPGCAPGECR